MTGTGDARATSEDTAERVALAAAMLGPIARHDVPLGPLTTYRVGGSARLFVTIEDEAGLARVVDAVSSSGIDVLVVGNGSNLLVADRGVDALAIVLGDAFAEIEVEGNIVRAGGAAMLPVVARQCAKAGLTGFEWAVGVPGSIGGAVRMNAGGHGSEMSHSLVRVRVVNLVTGEDEEVPSSALDLSYRHSSIKSPELVLRADLRLEAGDTATSEAEMSEIVRWRREHQPGGPNAGSVFTNPPGDSAGRIVEAAGLKGHRVGTAEVSTKHANFIQADPGGSAGDVLALMVEVRRRVRETAGIDLVPETRLAGFTAQELEA